MPRTISTFEQLLNKYKTRNLLKVLEFIENRARGSKQTAVAYAFALDHFNRFVERNYNYNYNYNIETILEPLLKEQIDRYKLLNDFISYLQNDTINGHDLSALSIRTYVIAVKSYFAYYDIEIVPSKFKNKVKMPAIYHEDDEAIDANDIRDILHHCNNQRLKAYLLVLASGGMRAVEALAIRECDLNLNCSPAEVRIRKEYAKTKRERRIFISDEAARYLNEWIEWKYRDRHAENKHLKNRIRRENDLIFSTINSSDAHGIYFKMLNEFQKVLAHAGLKSRKEDGVYKRRKITFHSFRRFVKTTIANQTRNSDYSEWFLGHKKSPYYTNKSDELRRIYKEDCMKYLTFLDYPTLEATGKSYEAKLKEKDREIEELRRKIERLTIDASEIYQFKKELDDLKRMINLK